MDNKLYTVVKLIKSEDKIYFRGGDLKGYPIATVFKKIKPKLELPTTLWKIEYVLKDHNNKIYLVIHSIEHPIHKDEFFFTEPEINFDAPVISKYFDYNGSKNYIVSVNSSYSLTSEFSLHSQNSEFSLESLKNLNIQLKRENLPCATFIISDKALNSVFETSRAKIQISGNYFVKFKPNWKTAIFDFGKLTILQIIDDGELYFDFSNPDFNPYFKHIALAFKDTFAKIEVCIYGKIVYGKSTKAEFSDEIKINNLIKRAQIQFFADYFIKNPIGEISNLDKLLFPTTDLVNKNTASEKLTKIIDELARLKKYKRTDNISYLAHKIGFEFEKILWVCENEKIGFVFCCNKATKSYIYETASEFGTYCWLGALYESTNKVDDFDIENELSILIELNRNPYKGRKLPGFEVVEHNSQSFEDWKIKINEFIAKANSFKIE